MSRVYNLIMQLTSVQEAVVIDLYVTRSWRIRPVIHEMMRMTGWRFRDVYPLVSNLLWERGVMKKGKGVVFGSRDFKWKLRTCDACHEEYKPTNAGQRFCGTCSASNLLVHYGITTLDYKAMWNAQQGRCAVCQCDLSKKLARNIHIDHCHKTARIRGIVCFPCNTRLGTLEDDVWVQKARVYLLKPGIEPRCECMATRKVQNVVGSVKAL